ncbi:inactive disease resistance protein RPS4 isoform X2 [Hevea brasiliensis]|uniref:inactive disease resistance protein RPS4 isoform X2 n=1 Tax=Hevea brasiliensis TaxID=3981 RepID=UPI0025F31280|nr:inactive disease resistance protein RPS4 isoform X2 [Hevea brasiliensis]
MEEIRIPNLSSIAPNLEFLYLEGCKSLVEIPSLQNLSKLTELHLSDCCKIKDCPEIPCNIRILTLNYTGIEQLPSSIKHLSQLVTLSLNDCKELVSLPSSIGNLKRLEQLFLVGCSRLVTIPSSIGELKCLESLSLWMCSNLASLPESIKQLSKLKELDLSDCESLKSLPELPSCLECLAAGNCPSLESASISFHFLEHEDENEEADKSEDENEKAYKSGFEDCKFLDFSDCVNLNKKVMEDVFEAHLLGEKVRLSMAGGGVPERMRYKNKGSSFSFELDLRHLIAFSFCVVVDTTHRHHFDGRIECRVDFIYESENRHGLNKFFLLCDRYFKNWNGYYEGPHLSDSSHVLLSFNELRTRFDEECFVKASICFTTGDEEEIMECGVHPIYYRNKRRSRNEEHQDDEQPHQHQDDEKGEPPLQRLEHNEDQNASIQTLTEEEQPHQHQDEEKGELPLQRLEPIEDQNDILNHERRKRKRKRKRKRSKIGHQNSIISIEKKHEEDNEGEPEDKQRNDLLNPEEEENQNDILNHERTKRKRKKKRKRRKIGHQNSIISIEKKHEEDNEGEPEDKQRNDLLNPEEDENQNDILNHERRKRKSKKKRKRSKIGH